MVDGFHVNVGKDRLVVKTVGFVVGRFVVEVRSCFRNGNGRFVVVVVFTEATSRFLASFVALMLDPNENPKRLGDGSALLLSRMPYCLTK